MAVKSDLERRFDAMQRNIEALQRQLGDLRTATLGDNGDDATVRALKFLKAFYEASGHRLVASDASLAATAAGYDARGTAGFYTGKNGSLRAEGSWRVLTDSGREWFEQYRHLLDDQLN